MPQEFKTEVRQLLNLMIHSLYSNRDIFLRELVANAADAIDKARFESLTQADQARDWQIRIAPDKEAGTLTISDNGIGMSAEEAAENLGTIARSGTRAFMKALEEKKDASSDMPEMIGQFGVGFYSLFMVADHVTVHTRKNGCDAVRWSSEGKESFEQTKGDRESIGTEIVITLKEDAKSYLDDWKIREIIHRYSDFIAYPIVLPTVKTNEDKTTTIEDQVLNSTKAIWLRKPSEVTEDEYQSFYAHVAHSPGKHLKAIHIAAEGASEFKALLFLPERAPFNLFMPDMDKKGLQLYVRRVFISDECKELLPDYLRFVAGVVDSSDLPLNVSREILQDNPQIARIRKGLVSRVLSELKKLQENSADEYRAFFREFGKVLKEGIHTDMGNADKLKALVMYESMSGEPGKLVSFAEYIAAMPGDQKEIYYLIADSRAHAESNPALEYFRKKGHDVLLMTDPIDEWIMQGMTAYEEKTLRNIGKGEFEPEDQAQKESIEALGKKYAKLVAFLKDTLKEDVGEVRFTARLTDSACCLVGKPEGMSAHMERLFQAMNQPVPKVPRVLELNGEHALIQRMGDALNGEAPDREQLGEYASLLLDQALLAEGSPIADPARFTQRLALLMASGISK